MKKKFLNITLNENISFEELKSKIEQTFNSSLLIQNQDGRLIAKGHCDKFSLNLIDRKDDLGDFLCDENHVLRIEVCYDEVIDYDKIEEHVKQYLENGNIKWIKGVWRPTEFLDDNLRELFP